jgi:hypothetical protein
LTGREIRFAALSGLAQTRCNMYSNFSPAHRKFSINRRLRGKKPPPARQAKRPVKKYPARLLGIRKGIGIVGASLTRT